MKSFVILRTHGGLGNQLFQILFGRLFAEQVGAILVEVHDFHYHHAFPRSTLLACGVHPSPYQALISAMRLPKILERVFRRHEKPLRLGLNYYLDAYFQRAGHFTFFPPARVGYHLRHLAGELVIAPATCDTVLVHLRLNDFFASRSEARSHAVARLRKIPQNAHVMTNDEQLLCEPALRAALDAQGAHLVSTQGMNSERVLRTMAQYRHIDANDSTLAFWASVLAGSAVTIRDETLRSCRDFLVQCKLAHA